MKEKTTRENDDMRDEYDFSNARPNPYAELFKRPVTIRLDRNTIEYFQTLSKENGIPYQTLINLYLRDCATTGRKPRLDWIEDSRSSNVKKRPRPSIQKRTRKTNARTSD